MSVDIRVRDVCDESDVCNFGVCCQISIIHDSTSLISSPLLFSSSQILSSSFSSQIVSLESYQQKILRHEKTIFQYLAVKSPVDDDDDACDTRPCGCVL